SPQVIGLRLARLLEHACAAVRCQTATLLAQLGQEQTLPALVACLERAIDPAADPTADSTVLRAVESAVQSLESAPPPPLQITLLGEFKVVRGDRLLVPDDWQRPAVRRLFQYFALHAGQMLSRERILDDLWPDTAPDAARNTFRTLFSWLRRTLDPYLRPKASARYFTVAGEIYCFAPAALQPLVRSDMAEFESTVQTALAQAHVDDLPQLSAKFLHVLEAWSPLLPELPYEPWAVTARERVNSLYVEGCLYAAQSLLNLQRAPEAAHWARRVILIAPWLEEAFQALMRAQARQGQRSLALKTHAEAVDALQRELDVPPSALTDWLAQRLRQGEDI
ncbi:MAG: BTAD domain-containing putative transcriptional regulator, partial [Litorilinea sp.]